MTMFIAERAIGPGHPTFIIAELSGNHNGSKARALELVQAAKDAGADAVKLQTYTADTITMDGSQAHFRINSGPWAGRTLYQLYQEAATPWDWHADIFAAARNLGLICFSTPFDPTAVAFLEQLGAPCHKVASFELVDIPLVECIALTGKPVIMSTGMATLSEIAMAVQALQRASPTAFQANASLALLTCVSAYPCAPEDFHLANIAALAEVFSCNAGLSDHSPGHIAAVAAVALGARVLEKHLCLRRAEGGPDAGFSMEPEEFRALVAAVRATEAACTGPVSFGASQADAGNVQFRRSLLAIRPIAAGTVITTADVRSLRPGAGLAPAFLPQVIGRIARRDIPSGTAIAWDLLA